MPKQGFSQTYIIADSVLIWENKCQRKPSIFCVVFFCIGRRKNGLWDNQAKKFRHSSVDVFKNDKIHLYLRVACSKLTIETLKLIFIIIIVITFKLLFNFERISLLVLVFLLLTLSN